ncbi:transposase [Bifidobacterium animalis]|uniref:transposase n=1 Tax=Bifidobacterium animalis TaxID=28025 RepID=UPI003B75CE4B
MAWFLFRISPNSMGDDGIMSKGTRYTDEFKAKAVRLLTSPVPRIRRRRRRSPRCQGSGVSSETLRRWRNQSDASAAEQSEQSAQEAMASSSGLRAENAELRRANEDFDDASAFFARARPDTP